MDDEINYNYKFNISVVIPTYNRQNTIERCLDSVLNQTFPAYEIIVVDDGSNDRTLEIINQKYGKQVKIIKQNHKGAQAARNAGIKSATGEYIAFLDSDDEWVPNKLELQAQVLMKNPNAVVCGNGYIQTEWKEKVPKVYIKSHGKKTNTHSKKIMRLNGKSGNVYKQILNQSFCLFPTLLSPKKSLVEIGFLDDKVPSYQEWDTAIRLAKNNEFVFIQKPLFIYHLHAGETISKSTKKSIDGMEYICNKFQYEIMGQLGSHQLVQRYKVILRLCMQYKDKRFFIYLLKYVLGNMHIFVLR